MSKESFMVNEATGKVVYLSQNPDSGPDGVVRHPGKTKRDHESGAWDNHMKNRSAKMDENRGSKK